MWVAEPITQNAYAILGVAPNSDHAAIVAAYRTMARRYHPDLAGEGATERMTQLNAAFDRLRTPARRADYDLELEHSGISRPRRANRGATGGAERSAEAGPSAASGASAATYRRRPEMDGTGGAGPPPGRPSGSVLPFGRHLGWSIGEIARVDPGYLAWLEEHRDGRPYAQEIDRVLRATGNRSGPDQTPDRKARRRR
jgi:curved DNA-binding protein CbpA